MANEFKLNAPFVPKIIQRTDGGSLCSEVFTLNDDTKTAAVVNTDGWQTEDTANGANYPVISDGFSKMIVWWVSDEAGSGVGPRLIIAGKRPFDTRSIIAAADGDIFDTHSEALSWFSCPPKTPTSTLSGAACLHTHAIEFSHVSNTDQTEDAIFYSGTTKIYGGPIIDVRGTSQVTSLVTQVSTADGYVLGQFIE